eukprot:3632285-Amphidinium_carterae.1
MVRDPAIAFAMPCTRSVRTKVLVSVPGILYSVVKAVPGFLQDVSDPLQWLISTAVATFSGLAISTTSTQSAGGEHTQHHMK